MTPTQIGLVGLVALFVLLALRMPVGLTMMGVGLVGFAALSGWGPALAILGREPFVIASNYELIVIPLFVLMGNFATVSGMSRDLYGAAYAWFGHWRGGLASATITACAGFAALSGSSVAAAVTMGRVALPEMRRYQYDPRLAIGCIAAGGTLGILIPPSTGFVLYAILTEESIGRLFLAGVVPGLLLTALFIVAIYLQTRLYPELGPAGAPTPWRDRLRVTGQASSMIGIVVLTIGGIYAGLFTPTEAAGIGAFLAFCLAVARGRLAWSGISSLMLRSIRTTGFVFLILIGAHIFNPFMARTHIPSDLAELLVGLDLPRLAVLGIVLAAYMILGTFLEGFAMLVLTLPIVHPLILALDFDPVWFGVVMVIVLEMGLISPPVGVNVFVVKGIAEDVPMRQIFAGILPFWLAMAVGLLLLIAFPGIALFLPNTMIR
ncbi:TRAP transporter large permease [Candidatus Entotheonella palauensis]|uniref:TRAP transporter large permease n=1 Tax=Candidatus Entotheonella palauensis TaxID=93172 RepID=UPI000B7F1CA3|nr:TRAP transporter large permease [Candidatus Entotheonella palauensis]